MLPLLVPLLVDAVAAVGAEDVVAAVADVDVVDVVVDVEVSFWKFLRKNFSAKNSLKCLRVLARPRKGEWYKQFSEAFIRQKVY